MDLIEIPRVDSVRFSKHSFNENQFVDGSICLTSHHLILIPKTGDAAAAATVKETWVSGSMMTHLNLDLGLGSQIVSLFSTALAFAHRLARGQDTRSYQIRAHHQLQKLSANFHRVQLPVHLSKHFQVPRRPLKSQYVLDTPFLLVSIKCYSRGNGFRTHHRTEPLFRIVSVRSCLVGEPNHQTCPNQSNRTRPHQIRPNQRSGPVRSGMVRSGLVG